VFRHIPSTVFTDVPGAAVEKIELRHLKPPPATLTKNVEGYLFYRNGGVSTVNRNLFRTVLDNASKASGLTKQSVK